MPKGNLKNKVITFKIEGETKELFEKFCTENYTTPSQKLYAFVHSSVKHSGKKLTLKDLLDRK